MRITGVVQAAGPFAAAFVLSAQGTSMMLLLMATMGALALWGSLYLPARSSA